MSTDSLTTFLVERVDGTASYIDDDARQKAAWFILDTIAVGLVGAREERQFVDAAAAVFQQLCPGDAAAMIVGSGRANEAGAAGAHAASIHTIDLDDSYLEGVKVHFSTSIVPTVLAVAQRVQATGLQVLDAYVRGFEVGAQLGHIVVPTHLRRWHPTGTLGVVACAAAAASLYGLDSDQIRSSIVLAGDRATGSRYFVRGGDVTKPFHAAWSAHDGIASALMAQGGVVAPDDFMEGENGYVATFSDAEARVPQETGRALVLDNSTKLYPAMHGLHAGIELSLAATRDHKITDVSDVKAIRAHQATQRAHMGLNWRPATALAAKLSMPFTVAVTLLDGEYGLAQCTDERLDDPVLREMMDRVEVVESPQLEQEYGARVATRLEVEFADGSKFDDTYADPPGTPRRPITDERRVAKVEQLLGSWCSADEIKGLIDASLGLADAGSIDSLIEAVTAISQKG